MRAIDTNVVVRFLTADDKRQAKAARAAIEAGDIFIATTVLLESEWVLRSGYGIAPSRIADGLRGLAGLPGITIEEPAILAQALDWMSEGMDFADALHLAKAGHCNVFLSFDRKLAKRAKGRAPIPVETP
ncbi:type II toxin-antitoxin system VapC family toxin [Sphingopyxis indica]|uniref:Predicted nucleic-acid-binding protein, contains PIN domain n=1 Tax=Sphingopyxis indica TaxID=436663 RepID=A0A239IKW4_9SPHN|nr:type II toxin-antitoxin system VapC family toxin [Sphingopyxis indica]SNS94227.1 Predicted nucleic-acid-binding protein, contains PIN domain [Sphingopyxis indica]